MTVHLEVIANDTESARNLKFYSSRGEEKIRKYLSGSSDFKFHEAHNKFISISVAADVKGKEFSILFFERDSRS